MKIRRGKKKTRTMRMIAALVLACAMIVPVSIALAGEVRGANSDTTDMESAEVSDLPASAIQAASSEAAATEPQAPVADAAPQPPSQTASDSANLQAAADDNWQDDFTYTAPSGGVVTLTGYTGAATDVSVPATVTIGGVEYKTAVSGQVFQGNSSITSVTFAPGVKLSSGDGMFEDCTALSQVDFTGVDANGCTTMQNMFKNCTSLEQVDLSVLAEGSDTGNMNGMFQGCVNLLSANLSGLDATLCSTVENMFAALSADQPMKLTSATLPDMAQSFCMNMGKMFYLCESLTDVELSGTNALGNFTLDQIHASPIFAGLAMTMEDMFYGCKSLTNLDVTGWNTNICKSMKGMFQFCESLTSLDAKDWVTTSCTDMSSMFAGCTSLQSLDVSEWDVSNVVTLESAFEYVPSTTIIDLSKWNVNSVATTGWNRAFGDGPKASPIAVGESLPYYTGQNQYLAFGANGDYAVLLDKKLDRVYCLNLKDDVPTGNLVTLTHVPLADIDTLTDVTYAATADDWTKIAAAIMFFGNDLSEYTQRALQAAILMYADHADAEAIAASLDDPEHSDAIMERALEIKEYVDNNFTRLDYSDVVVDYYARPDGASYQNLISIETAKTVKAKETGSLKVTKDFTEGTKVGDKPFSFTVKLKNEDGSAYRGDVQALGADGEFTVMVPDAAGKLVLSILGVGEHMLSALPVGVSFEVTETAVDGWILVTSSGTSGAIAGDATATASFTNEEDVFIDPQDDPTGGDTPDPGPGGDTPEPGPGGDTPEPGGDTPDPGPGGDTPEPGPGGDTPEPSPGGDTPEPGGNTPDPGGNTDPSGGDKPDVPVVPINPGYVDPMSNDPANNTPANNGAGNQPGQADNARDAVNQGDQELSGSGSSSYSAKDMPRTGDSLFAWPLIALVVISFAVAFNPRKTETPRHQRR